MTTSSTPVRLDAEITAAARKVAPRMSRSVAEQISHWARIGRELERSPNVSLSEIEAVLAETANYDALMPKQQALVRSVWTARMNALRNALRLDRLFDAAGYRYAELDAHGAVVIREPAPARKAQVVPLKSGRRHPQKKKRA